MANFITKANGEKLTYKSGFKKETDINKPRFDLLIPKSTKFDNSMLYRWSMLLSRGANKYSERNWEKANSLEEMDKFKASAFRHFMQWFHGETDEDHAAAILFNVNAVEYVKDKL